MSSKKRRIKRKIETLVRMNATRERMYHSRIVELLGGQTPQTRFWLSCMVPLGRRLSRMGLRDRATAVLEAAGANISKKDQHHE